MANPTVRKDHLGGALQTTAPGRPRSARRRRRFFEIESLDVVYNKALALENVSLHMHQEEFVAVVGLNGADKTTLFNAVSGLTPYAGDIRRQGQSLRGRTGATIARGGSFSRRKGANCSG